MINRRAKLTGELRAYVINRRAKLTGELSLCDLLIGELSLWES